MSKSTNPNTKAPFSSDTTVCPSPTTMGHIADVNCLKELYQSCAYLRHTLLYILQRTKDP